MADGARSGGRGCNVQGGTSRRKRKRSRVRRYSSSIYECKCGMLLPFVAFSKMKLKLQGGVGVHRRLCSVCLWCVQSFPPSLLYRFSSAVSVCAQTPCRLRVLCGVHALLILVLTATGFLCVCVCVCVCVLVWVCCGCWIQLAVWMKAECARWLQTLVSVVKWPSEGCPLFVRQRERGVGGGGGQRGREGGRESSATSLIQLQRRDS